MANTCDIPQVELRQVHCETRWQDAHVGKICGSIPLVPQEAPVAPREMLHGKGNAASPSEGSRRCWPFPSMSASRWGAGQQNVARSMTSSMQYARPHTGASALTTAKIPPLFLRCLFVSALLALSWACIPSLLCCLVDVLVAYEPSPLRTFAVACLKDEAGARVAATLPQDIADPRKRDGMDVVSSPDDGEASGCQSLVHLRSNWAARPPFEAFTTFLNAATLCSLDVLRFAGLGPLLPEPATVRRRLGRLGPILSAIFLMARFSHEPVQPPCEEWVIARAMTSRKSMLSSTDAWVPTPDTISRASPFDFVIVGGGAAGSTLAGLLGRLERPQARQGRGGLNRLEQRRDVVGPEGKMARVLVLEAGGWPDIRSFSPLKIPAKTYESQRGTMDWSLTTTKQTQACKVSCAHPQTLASS